MGARKRPLFSGLVLLDAGGLRAGTQQAMALFQGRPLWRRQAELLAQAGAAEVFLATHDGAACIGEPFRILVDSGAGRGPLEGIRQALAASHTTLVVALAADLAAMQASMLQRLLSHGSSACGCVPMRPEGRLEPLAAVYPTRALSLAAEHIRRGEYSVDRFAETCLNTGVAKLVMLDTRDLRFVERPGVPPDWPPGVSPTPAPDAKRARVRAWSQHRWL